MTALFGNGQMLIERVDLMTKVKITLDTS